MGSACFSGERRKYFSRLNRSPDASGFIGSYSLDGLDPYMKRAEVRLELPEESHWYITDRNRFKVYMKKVSLGKKRAPRLRRIGGKRVTIEIQRGMNSNHYEYKWG
jgi:hypothetical protein